MGSPLSPAMAIATTAYMEEKWHTKWNRMHPKGEETYGIRRFMDDVIVIYAGEEGRKAYEDFRKNAYDAPLKLEEAEQDTYLEMKMNNGKITERRLKNKNENSATQILWRYQRYESYTPYAQKWATMMAAMKKVQQYATNEQQLMCSARLKLREFESLGYPMKVLRMACYKMKAMTYNNTWQQIVQPFTTLQNREQHQ